ncbi:MAG: DUF1858 domain-containing protein [Candidatus Pacebacteria bacterium]|nr:DUF1858 domain-containing protein [Candidatus Paceibacterota bacterium]
MKKITKDTTLKELMEIPELTDIILKYNFPCLGCPMAAQEKQFLKISDIAQMYKIDMEGFLKEANKMLTDKK